MSDDFPPKPERDTSGSIPPPPPGTPPPARPPEPEPEPAPAPQEPAPPVADGPDPRMVADMLRGYAEDITNISARLDRFGSNAPAVSDMAREQATALSRIASALLDAADGLA